MSRALPAHLQEKAVIGATISGRHPSSAVLLDHVSGTLGLAHRLVVDTHVSSCRACQDTILLCETIGTALLAVRQPVQSPAGLLDRCLASITEHDAPHVRHQRGVSEPDASPAVGETVLPPSLDGLTPGRLRWLAPGIRHSLLWRDHDSTLHFIRVSAGAALPPHRHRGLELTCVLSGAFQSGGERYDVGDISEEDDDATLPRPEHDHLVMAEPAEDCVCIMSTTGRLRFSGWMARLLQPVMPF